MPNKNKRYSIYIWLIAAIDLLLLVGITWHGNFALLNPKGVVAAGEKRVTISAVLLMLIVVVPVLSAAFFIAHKYRADGSAEYRPNWDEDAKLQFFWWAFPGVIVICLGILTWKASHAFDPFRHLDSNVTPITIEVISLNWKWLFIYPKQNIATVNFIEFPAQTPVNFVLTSDAPMNSFWIPQLGGQMYAMAGMTTQLHLIADQSGEFGGSAAEINGKGFAGMRFAVKAVSDSEFDNWLKSVHAGQLSLDMNTYEQLAAPSTNNLPAFYGQVEPDLFNAIVQKYMSPDSRMAGMQANP